MRWEEEEEVAYQRSTEAYISAWCDMVMMILVR